MLNTAVGLRVAPPDPLEVCDRSECPAKAVVRVEFMRGSLVFCGHHADTMSERLISGAIGFCDTRKSAN